MDRQTRARRNVYLHFRVSLAEQEALRRLQDAEATGASEVLRLALRELARKRGVWPIQSPEHSASVTVPAKGGPL